MRGTTRMSERCFDDTSLSAAADRGGVSGEDPTGRCPPTFSGQMTLALSILSFDSQISANQPEG